MIKLIGVCSVFSVALIMGASGNTINIDVDGTRHRWRPPEYRMTKLIEVKSNADANRDCRKMLSTVMKQIRAIDQQLIAQYSASNGTERVLILCVPNPGKSADASEIGYNVRVFRVEAQKGGRADQVILDFSGPGNRFDMWVDYGESKIYHRGDRLSFNRRKAVVLHAMGEAGSTDDDDGDF